MNKRWLKIGLTALAVWLLLVIACWAIWLLPIRVRDEIRIRGSLAIGKELTVRRLTLNPFGLKARVEGICIAEPDGGHALVAIDEISVNLAISSLWGNAIDLESVEISGPHTRMVRRADGSLDLADLGKQSKPPEKVEADAPGKAIIIRTLHISNLAALLDDRVVDCRHTVRGLSVQAADFSTRPADAGTNTDCTIAGIVNDAVLNVTLAAMPFQTVPDFRVTTGSFTGIDLTHYLPYGPIPPALQIESARLDLAAFKIDAALPAAGPQITVTAKLKLSDLAVNENGHGVLLRLPELSVELAESHPMTGDIHVAALSLNGAEVHLARAADGELNILRAISPPTAADNGSAKPVPPATPPEQPPFRIRIDTLAVQELTIDLLDNAASSPFHTRLIPISATFNNIDTAPDSAGKFDLNGASADGERFQLRGTFGVTPPAFSLDVACGPIPLQKYAPYYKDFAAVDITDGSIAVSLHAAMSESDGISVKDGVLTLDNLRMVARADQRPLASITHFEVNGAAASLMQRRASIGNLLLAGDIYARRMADGTIDWQSLLPPPAPDQPAKVTAPASPVPQNTDSPFVFTLDKMAVNPLVLHLQDQAVTPAFLRDVTVNLAGSNLSTGPKVPGTITLAVQTPEGETVDVTGTVQLTPMTADLKTAVSGLVAARYRAYYDHAVNFIIDGGEAGMQLSVHLPPEGQDRLTINDAKIEVRNLALKPRDSNDAFLQIADLAISGVSADLAAHRAAVGLIALNGASIEVARLADGTVDLATRLSPPATAQQPAANAPQHDAAAPAAAWIGTVTETAIRTVAVHFRDQSLATPVALDLTDLALMARNFTTATDSAPGTFELRARINKDGDLKLTGEASPASRKATIAVNLADIAVQPFEPYIRSQLNVLLQAGILRTTGTLAVDAGSTPPSVTWNGDTGVASFAMIDPSSAEPLLKWEDLSVKELSFRQSPLQVKVGSIHLEHPYAGLSLAPDGTLNLSAIVRKSPTEESAPPPTTVPPAETTAPPDVTIASISINDGEILFRDNSITPAADQHISNLVLGVKSLSLQDQRHADFSLTGTLGAQARLTAAGTLRPAPLSLNATLQLSGYQLPPVSPYSGRFIAWTIGTGKLGLDLKYQVEGTAISAGNIITLDQFELGEKVDSPDAVNLPLKLAIALLKDSDGIIKLDVPVQGDLNDPEFKIGKVILRVLGNLITKAATSPFTMLASLAGSEKPLDQIPFSPGTIKLDDEAISRLEALAAALKKRPSLAMAISGTAGDEDRNALIEAAYDAKLRGQKAQIMLAAGKGVVSADEIVIPESERPALAAAVYQEANLPPLPPLPAEAPPEIFAAHQQQIRAALLTTITIGDADLNLLANKRAEAVQTWLRDVQISDERLFIGAPETSPNAAPQVHFSPK